MLRKKVPDAGLLEGIMQWWDSYFSRTGSLSLGITNNRFCRYHSLQREAMLVCPISVQRLILYVANWYSLAREITDFSYFPKF